MYSLKVFRVPHYLRLHSPFDGLNTFKTGPLDDRSKLSEKKKSQIKWIGKFFQSAGCSAQPVPLLFRHAQIFGDNFPNAVLFHIQTSCNHSNSQPTITTHYLSTHSTLISVLLVESILHLKSYFSFFHPSFNVCHHSKIRVTDMVLSPHICWSISSACVRFSKT